MKDMAVRWRLRELLAREGVTAYRLAQQMGGENRRSAIYAITSPDPKQWPRRVSFDLLSDVATALRALTGQTYGVDDFLEFVPAARLPKLRFEVKQAMRRGSDSRHLCDLCNDFFSVALTHCRHCGAHYPTERGDCGNCSMDLPKRADTRELTPEEYDAIVDSFEAELNA